MLLFVAAACVAGSTAWAKSPKNSEVSHILCPARYVYVATMDGDVFNPRVIPEDRDAVARVEEKLRDWKRYIEVYQPQQSDIVLIVRTGRLGTVQGATGTQVGTGPVRPGTPGARGPLSGGSPATQDPTDASQGPDAPAPGTNPPYGRNHPWVGAGGEVGPPNDLLAVYTKPGNIDTQTPMWQKTQKDGLDGPKVPLFEQFHKAIDASCQDQPEPKKNP